MRLSRRGGLLGSDGVRWEKYACTNTISVYTWYSEGAWGPADSAGGNRISGYPAYTFSSVTGQFANSGTMTNVISGSLYSASGSTLTKYSLSGTTITVTTKTAVQHTGYTDNYSVGSRLGTVYAAKGTKPDSRRGYVYVGTASGGYTIMRDGNYNYFAYREAA